MAEAWKEWEGQIVDGAFRLREYLGGSDHSAVFLTVRDGPEPQKAAIKLVRVDPQGMELQLSRWGLALELSHPHLIRLFHVGRCRIGEIELLYVVMEQAEEDLSQILSSRPLTEEEARGMLPPVLDALAYLHEKGLTHGHLKPANIMAVGDELRISSDGVCRVGELISVREPTVYEAPESASAGSSVAGDIWSLGMTLVEALSQRVPAWSRAKQEEPALLGNLPDPFLDIARHCLRLKPEQRWTVPDIAARLQPDSSEEQATATEGTLPAVPQPPSVAPLRAAKRYIFPVLGIALAVVAIVGGARLLHRRTEIQPPPMAETEQPVIQPKPEQAPAAVVAQPSPGTTSEKQLPSESENKPSTSHTQLKARTIPAAIVHSRVLEQVLPEVSQGARNTIQGTVRVRVKVRVDASGGVVATAFDSPGPSRYFAGQAIKAAKRWKFAPAQAEGQAVASEWILRFEFRRTGTRAVPVSIAP